MLNSNSGVQVVEGEDEHTKCQAPKKAVGNYKTDLTPLPKDERKRVKSKRRISLCCAVV